MDTPEKSPHAPIDFKQLLNLRAKVISLEANRNHLYDQIAQHEQQIVAAKLEMLELTDHAFNENIDAVYVNGGTNVWILTRQPSQSPQLRVELTFNQRLLRTVEK